MRGSFYESAKFYVRHRSLCGSNVNPMQPHSKINTRYAKILINSFTSTIGDRGITVVKVLCYKSEGRWFDPIWCHWNFSLT